MEKTKNQPKDYLYIIHSKKYIFIFLKHDKGLFGTLESNVYLRVPCQKLKLI